LRDRFFTVRDAEGNLQLPRALAERKRRMLRLSTPHL
jgi:hypothetical protein